MGQGISKPVAGAQLKIQARIVLDDEIAFGPGKADLLEAIESTGSITAAGKQLAMSYRRAWSLVDSMNRCFQQPLVESSAGGSQGGGTYLTAMGQQVLRDYRALQAELAALKAAHFVKFQPLLRKTAAAGLGYAFPRGVWERENSPPVEGAPAGAGWWVAGLLFVPRGQ